MVFCVVVVQVVRSIEVFIAVFTDVVVSGVVLMIFESAWVDEQPLASFTPLVIMSSCIAAVSESSILGVEPARARVAEALSGAGDE